MTIESLRAIIEKEDYEFYGIRVDETMVYEVGDTCYNSHQWWQDEPWEDDIPYDEEMRMWDGGELNGTCCLWVKADTLEEALERSKAYGKKHITLIAGDCAEGGNDIGEIIIARAKVMAVIK